MGRIIDMTNWSSEFIKVIECGGSDNGRAMWKCLCICGKEFICSGKTLRSGATTSCGCGFGKAKMFKRNHLAKVQSGEIPNVNTRLYSIWYGVKKRCRNVKDKYHGGKGIKICKDWENYFNFEKWANSAGYSDSLTLDRIDVNGDYCPENCRWVSYLVQENNRSNTVYVEYKGKKYPRAILARMLGMSNQALIYRLEKGIPVDMPKTKCIQHNKSDLTEEQKALFNNQK